MISKLFVVLGLVASMLVGNLESVANARFSRFLYRPRANMGIPQSVIGGATRSVDCTNNCLISLVPEGTIPLTTQARPSFFFFVPPLNDARARFQLFDNGDRIYQVTFDLPKTGGIAQFALPADAPALVENKNYQWRVVLRSARGLNDTTGFVRKVSLKQPAIAPEPLQAAAIYAQEGIWLDMLKSLATDRSPAALTQMQEVLQSAKLGAIANQPLLECCKPTN